MIQDNKRTFANASKFYELNVNNGILKEWPIKPAANDSGEKMPLDTAENSYLVNPDKCIGYSATGVILATDLEILAESLRRNLSEQENKMKEIECKLKMYATALQAVQCIVK